MEFRSEGFWPPVQVIPEFLHPILRRSVRPALAGVIPLESHWFRWHQDNKPVVDPFGPQVVGIGVYGVRQDHLSNDGPPT